MPSRCTAARGIDNLQQGPGVGNAVAMASGKATPPIAANWRTPTSALDPRCGPRAAAEDRNAFSSLPFLALSFKQIFNKSDAATLLEPPQCKGKNARVAPSLPHR